MTRHRILPALAATLMLVAGLSTAHAQAGSTGLAFLKFGSGARALGMGDAGVASATLASGLHYNPALAGLEDRSSIAVMHNAWVQDITVDALTALVRLDGWSFGLNLVLSSVGDIEVRSVPGEAVESFDSQNFSVGATIAVPFSPRFSAGISAKYLFEKIYVDAADGYAFDAGLAWLPFEDGPLKALRTGIALTNTGSMQALRNESSTLPTAIRYGVSHAVPVDAINGSIGMTVEGLTVLKESTHLNVGFEADYARALFVRAGYQTGYDIKGVSFGLGAAWTFLRFDYALTPFSDNFGTSHTVTVAAIL